MDPFLETKWHSLSVPEIFKILESGESGLSRQVVAERLARDGKNKLPEAKVDSLFTIFIRQFANPLIYILLIAGIVVFIMGEVVDSIVITLVLIFNAIIGAIQEGKARNTILALKRYVNTKAVVIRDGEEFIIPDEMVTVGDVIILQEGEKIPADARLISAHNLKVSEAALTGESESVHKHTNPLKNENTPTLERKNMVFKGTNIAAGNGVAVVIATGAQTIIGKIAQNVAGIDTDMPLKRNVKNLSRVFIVGTIFVCILIFVLGMLYGYSTREMFATAVSVAVSAIPSGLPIAFTIILATGVWRMSQRNALIKRLQAVEALGQARIIAVDKTGTLTKNEMMAQAIWTNGKIFEVGGIGYEPKGELRLDGKEINAQSFPELMIVGKLSAFCASARVMFDNKKNEWAVAGDPTEASLFVLGNKLGFQKDTVEKDWPQLAEIPFDYSLKYHATLHKEGRKGGILTVIGAPEAVLSLSTNVWTNGRKKKISKKEREQMEEVIHQLSGRGLRVLALAMNNLKSDSLDKGDVKSLTFIGFLGLKDALRPEVRDATRRAHEAGVKVVMITGDHKETAIAIGKEAGIYKHGDTVLTGIEIDDMPEDVLKEKIKNVTIFARVTPEHKLKIIEAYKAREETIAMTGDGVNDAPSLVAADLGVGMGITGTEVAKEASDIVLLDDNFGSIISAIEEGRGIYKTIKKVIVYLVSTSLGEVLVIAGALIVGLPLPLLAAQIIWLNFVTDGLFIPALAMEPREKNLLHSGFERASKYMIDKSMALRMFLMAAPMTIFTLILFAGTYQDDMTKAMTVALTLLAVFQWFNAWNTRSDTESIFKMNPWSNLWLIGGTIGALALQLMAVYHPFFQNFLRTVPLAFSDWAIIIALATSIIAIEEIRKSLSWQSKKSWSSPARPLQANRI
jgi:P-type Ca2+ transporter type 2C